MIQHRVPLTHLFLLDCVDHHELLDGIVTFNDFAKRLEKQAGRIHKGDQKKRDKYVGNGFELFSEMLFMAFPFDRRLGVTDFRLTETDAPGWDGFGIGINGRPAVVQIKYRGDPTHELKGDDLGPYLGLAFTKYGVSPQDYDNILVITAGKDLHYYLSQQYEGRIRCKGREDLKKMVDGVVPFWECFRASWDDYLEELKRKKR